MLRQIHHSRRSLCVALLLCTPAVAPAASSIVTFSVDMSVQIGLGAFVPGTDTVSARGTFNNWNTYNLTNDPSGPAPTVYSGTVNDTTNPNGGVETYKFYNSHNGQWDDGAVNSTGKNRAARLPATPGASLVLPTVYFGDAGPQVTNTVTFQVNMAQQINAGLFNTNSQTVYARGTFNSWGLSFPLTNDPSILTTNNAGLVTSNVYVGTYEVPSGTNTSVQFKYAFDPGGAWETPAANNQVGGGDGNRFFLNTGNQALPLVDYNDVPYSAIVNNDVTFQVDMTAQIFAGRFNPANGDLVEVRGAFNSWGFGAQPLIYLTNNASAANTNIYSAKVRIVDTKGSQQAYKFTIDNPGVNWESSSPKLSTPDSGPNDYNRVFNLTTVVGSVVATTMPVVLWDDKKVNDYLPAATLVTLTVDMNGAVGTDGHVFDPAKDTVWVNGQFANWNGQAGNWYPWWATNNLSAAPPELQMLENPIGSGIYSNQVLIPKGTPVGFSYKYGIGYETVEAGPAVGPFDDEALGGQDHFRVVRSTVGGAYQMARDKFGNQNREPLFSATAKGDGQLAVSAPAGGVAPVKWLGRPGAHLQSSSSASGPWTDHPNTDGSSWSSGTASANGLVSVTNWPAAGDKFFRLVNP